VTVVFELFLVSPIQLQLLITVELQDRYIDYGSLSDLFFYLAGDVVFLYVKSKIESDKWRKQDKQE
jgi:hypothetical protein